MDYDSDPAAVYSTVILSEFKYIGKGQAGEIISFYWLAKAQKLKAVAMIKIQRTAMWMRMKLIQHQ